jgi:hypothetical protein
MTWLIMLAPSAQGSAIGSSLTVITSLTLAVAVFKVRSVTGLRLHFSKNLSDRR